jgi:hypothetical protein
MLPHTRSEDFIMKIGHLVYAFLYPLVNGQRFSSCSTLEINGKNTSDQVSDGSENPLVRFRKDLKMLTMTKSESISQMVITLNSLNLEIQNLPGPLHLEFFSLEGYTVVVPGDSCQISFEKPFDSEKEFFIQWNPNDEEKTSDKIFTDIVFRLFTSDNTYEKYQKLSMIKSLVNLETDMTICPYINRADEDDR